MAAGVTRVQRMVLAMVCAVAVSTIYAIQPILAAVGNDLRVAPEWLGGVVAAGQIGYFIGLVLLVPLGDVVNRRRLIIAHLVLTAAGTAIAAGAVNGVMAAAGLVIAGVFAVVVQVTVAYAAALSAPSERGRTIGAVTSGVVIGILGVRVLAGVLGDVFGWRAVYLVLAALCVVLAVTVRGVLDPDPRHAAPRYGRVLISTGRLVRTDRLLLSRGLIALFLFASFGTLWSGLALLLGAEPWNLDTTQIGLFGLAGLAGAAGAARAGRGADAGRAQAIIGWSLALLTLSWMVIACADVGLWLLVIGIVLLDFAVQAVHVGNQHLLTTAHPNRVSSVIGAYMAFYSLGSALGAVTTTWAYTGGGWAASCGAGAGYGLCALLVWGLARLGGSGDAANTRFESLPDPARVGHDSSVRRSTTAGSRDARYSSDM